MLFCALSNHIRQHLFYRKQNIEDLYGARSDIVSPLSLTGAAYLRRLALPKYTKLASELAEILPIHASA